MNEAIENVIKAMEGVERLSGLSLTLKWIEVPPYQKLATLETQHLHDFCTAIKYKKGLIKNCQQDCQYSLSSLFKEKEVFQQRKCHAGMTEWYFAIKVDQKVVGVLCVGPVEKLPTLKGIKKSVFKNPQEEWRDLLFLIAQQIEKCYLESFQIMIREYSPVIQKAMEFMKQNCHESLTVDMIASFCCLSPSRLMHRFQEETKATMMDFLLKYRIELAQKKLIKSTDKIIHIAYEVGIKNQTYFGQKFKELTGYRPRDFRKKYQAKEKP